MSTIETVLDRRFVVLLAFVSLACSEPSADEGDGDGSTDTSADTETGNGDGDGDGAPGNGLPEGMSTWTGQFETTAAVVAADLTIINNGGDLEVTMVWQEQGFEGTSYTLTGTHEPSSNLVALAPLAWVVDPPIELELLGFNGSYDPEAQILSGMIVDYATGVDNVLLGGPASFELVDGPGAPTVPGDGANGIELGTRTVTGTTQCTGAAREVAGDLEYDGQGGISGTITVGDPDVAFPLGTFEVSGVHNPTTGGVTLVPGLWTEWITSVLTFSIDGTYDASTGEFKGDVRTNTNACPPGTWNTTLE